MGERLAKLKEAIGFDIVISAVVAGLLDFMRNGIKKGGEVATEKITKKLEEHRAEMLAFIRGLAAEDKEASEKFFERQKIRNQCKKKSYSEEKYKPGDEDLYVELLTKLYIALNEPQEQEIRKEIFKWLGHLSDEDFDLTLEFLKHDVFIQWIRRFWGGFKVVSNEFYSALKKIKDKLYSTNPQVPGLYQKVYPEVESLIKKIRVKLYSTDPNSLGLYQQVDAEVMPKLESFNDRLEDYLIARRAKYNRRQKTYR